MGEVYIKVRKPSDTKDGIATDSISKATGSSSENFDITGYDAATRDGQVRNTRIALCNKVKVYESGVDKTTAWGAEIVAIIIKQDDER